MGTDLEMQGRLETKMESLTNEVDPNVKAKEVEHMVCASNYEDNTFEMGTLLGERNEKADEIEDIELNLLDSKNSHVNTPVQFQSLDITESSSSFGDTISDIEIGDNGNDTEVESEFLGNPSPTVDFGGCDDLLRMRKKKVTPQWRAFIQPLMWRSKWAELQIKKFQSQALKYDKILAENKNRKQLKVDSFAPGLCAKSLPYANDSQRVKIMKRKKREKVEDSIDTALSNHTLFSYFGNGISVTNAVSNGPDWRSQLDAKPDGDEKVGATNGKLRSLDPDLKDELGEKLLWKISVAQSKVGELKDRLHKIEDEFLTHNKRANKGLNDFGEVKIHPTDKKLKAPKREQGVISPPTMVAREILNSDDQETPKIRSISEISSPKNKKKRAERKPRTGKWSRKSSG